MNKYLVVFKDGGMKLSVDAATLLASNTEYGTHKFYNRVTSLGNPTDICFAICATQVSYIKKI